MAMKSHLVAISFLLASFSLQALANTTDYSHGRSPRRPIAPRPFRFPQCMYFPFHETHALFTAGEQERVGEVSVDLSDRKLQITYSVDMCHINAGHVNLVQRLTLNPLPFHFACHKKVSSAKRKVTLTCPLKLFPNVLCCKDFFIYTHASLTCGRKMVDAYGGEPSCSRPTPRKWGRKKGGRAIANQCNVIVVSPPCPRECTCDRKCVCPRPMPSMSISPIPSISNSPIPSASNSPIPSVSSSPMASMSRSPTPSMSSSPMASMSSSPTPSMSRSPTPSMSSSPMASMSSSPTPSMSSSPMASMSSSPTPSMSSSPMASMSSSPTPSMSTSPTPSMSSSPMASMSSSPTPSMSTSPTPSMSSSPMASMSSSPTPSMSTSPTPSMSSSPMASMSTSPTPSMSNSAVPSVSPSPTPCMCPNCFICMGIDANGNSICEPDSTTNDAECNPCENGGDQFCEATGLPNAFQCCPPTSNCKSDVIPTRLGVDQDSLEVSFVCSRNCGAPCADIRNSDGTSNACALFTPLVLNDDMDPDTDDVLNLCPDVSAD